MLVIATSGFNQSFLPPAQGILYVGTSRVGYSFPFWLSTLPYPCIAISPAVLVVIKFEEHMWLMRTVLMFDFRPELVGSDRVVLTVIAHPMQIFGRVPGKPNKILIY